MMDRTFADNKSEGLQSPSNLPIVIVKWPRNSRALAKAIALGLLLEGGGHG